MKDQVEYYDISAKTGFLYNCLLLCTLCTHTHTKDKNTYLKKQHTYLKIYTYILIYKID